MVVFLAVPGIAACTTKTAGHVVAAPARRAELPILIRQTLRNEMTLQGLFMGAPASEQAPKSASVRLS